MDDKKIIASYYINSTTNCLPYLYNVQNVERAAERCGTNLVDLTEAFRKLPYNAEISLSWNPEDEGGVDTLTYVFTLANK